MSLTSTSRSLQVGARLVIGVIGVALSLVIGGGVGAQQVVCEDVPYNEQIITRCTTIEGAPAPTPTATPAPTTTPEPTVTPDPTETSTPAETPTPSVTPVPPATPEGEAPLVEDVEDVDAESSEDTDDPSPVDVGSDPVEQPEPNLNEAGDEPEAQDQATDPQVPPDEEAAPDQAAPDEAQANPAGSESEPGETGPEAGSDGLALAAGVLAMTTLGIGFWIASRRERSTSER